MAPSAGPLESILGEIEHALNLKAIIPYLTCFLLVIILLFAFGRSAFAGQFGTRILVRLDNTPVQCFQLPEANKKQRGGKERYDDRCSSSDSDVTKGERIDIGFLIFIPLLLYAAFCWWVLPR
ncbi:MAG: hypothetical protein KGJ90_00015 [Patescibacteria group bacterium]|nr:hypothetical protein [Patescibacteria group bacterium]